MVLSAPNKVLKRAGLGQGVSFSYIEIILSIKLKWRNETKHTSVCFHGEPTHYKTTFITLKQKKRKKI